MPLNTQIYTSDLVSETIKNIIFDLGGVLIDWNPEYVYLDVFNGDREKMQWFFDNICTSDWNENQDAGYPMAKATEERIALFPEYENPGQTGVLDRGT